MRKWSRPPLSAWSLQFDSHNARVFKSAAMFAALLVLGTGCGTGNARRPTAAMRSPRAAATPVSESSPPTTGSNVPPAVTALPPLITNTPPPLTTLPVVPKPATNPPAITFKGEGWIPLERWTEAMNLERPRRLATAPTESFALVLPVGVVRFSVGSQVALWDGVEFRFGFPPRAQDGQVYLHSLDLRKNIEPLLKSRAPLKAPARVIVLDPGHGGINSGTRSAADVRNEKYFTLDWALRIAGLLRTNGWNVILTRTNDVDVSLADRVALAEAQRADLFISLHFNSAGGNGTEQAGLETYCLTPQGMTSTLTRGYDDDAKEWSPNNAFDEDNLLLALRLHRALLRVNGNLDRGVRRARFLTVLRGQNRPAALIEGGYLSNPAEARRVADPAFRQRLAEAVAKALQ